MKKRIEGTGREGENMETGAGRCNDWCRRSVHVCVFPSLKIMLGPPANVLQVQSSSPIIVFYNALIIFQGPSGGL